MKQAAKPTDDYENVDGSVDDSTQEREDSNHGERLENIYKY